MQMGHRASRMRNRWFRFLMGMGVVFLTPVLLIAERFSSREKRPFLWRRGGALICGIAFAGVGIRIRVTGRAHIPAGPAIYAANHGSAFDGFMLSLVLGPHAALFTAPRAVFPKPLGFWMKKMGAIDVRRDMFDDARYPRSENKTQAFRRVDAALRRGESLIVFPEGHLEYLHVLHYFHTGATRLSIVTQAPIVPVAMVGPTDLFPDEYTTRPGTVVIHFDRPLAIPDDGALTDRAAVRRLRDALERRLVALLPLRYLPPYYFVRKPQRIGVFVDIDHTLYEGITLVDLVWFLFGLHKIHTGDVMRSMYWLFLERAHVIPHEEMMKRELLALRGWNIGELRHLVNRAFEERMKKKINYHLFSMLKDHAERGHTIVLVTETIHPLAAVFRRAFGARAVFDTTLKTAVRHGRRCYTGDIGCLCYKEKKAALVSQFAKRAGIDLAASYGYGDSAHDAPFLKLLGHPVAVHPDHELARIAAERGWAVLDRKR
ncbi:MAG: HAD-IB family hydrolase [Patescibacteria group bacterium]